MYHFVVESGFAEVGSFMHVESNGEHTVVNIFISDLNNSHYTCKHMPHGQVAHVHVAQGMMQTCIPYVSHSREFLIKALGDIEFVYTAK